MTPNGTSTFFKDNWEAILVGVIIAVVSGLLLYVLTEMLKRFISRQPGEKTGKHLTKIEKLKKELEQYQRWNANVPDYLLYELIGLSFNILVFSMFATVTLLMVMLGLSVGVSNITSSARFTIVWFPRVLIAFGVVATLIEATRILNRLTAVRNFETFKKRQEELIRELENKKV